MISTEACMNWLYMHNSISSWSTFVMLKLIRAKLDKLHGCRSPGYWCWLLCWWLCMSNSEWVITFKSLSRTPDIVVHIIHICRVIITCTLELSFLAMITETLGVTINFNPIDNWTSTGLKGLDFQHLIWNKNKAFLVIYGNGWPRNLPWTRY